MPGTVNSSGVAASGVGFAHDGPGAGWNDYTGFGHPGNGTLVVTWTSGSVPAYRFGSVELDLTSTGGAPNNAYLFIGTTQGNALPTPSELFSVANVTRTQLLTSGYTGLQDNSTSPGMGLDYGFLNVGLSATLTYWVTPTITNVSPGTGFAGDTVTVTFSEQTFSAPTITFGGISATDITTGDGVNWTCTVPPTIIGGTVDVVATIDYGEGSPDVITDSNAFTYLALTWQITTPLGVFYQNSTGQPDPFLLAFDVFLAGILYPAGTPYIWVLAGSPPADTGWWLSIDETFAGAAFTLNDTRPKDPRGFVEITDFASGSAKAMGGFPGPGCVWNNHFVYAEGNYTPATDPPVIRIFDGEFDRPVTSLPNTSAGVVPKGIMSMLSANGTIYLSTFDTGTSSSDYVGRVFSLDIISGELAPIGDPFPTGHIPYALAWHAGRLWVGTNRQSSTASGHVYFFRPGIDTAWTDDYTISTSSVAGCTSLLSYGGKLYVGTSAASGTFAKVLVRSELGVYSTAKTASGGTATANNEFPALVQFGDNLYASYWNNDGTPVSLIYKYDGSSWTTAYTGSGTTNIPFIGFPTDGEILLTIGGGVGYNAALLSTPDGTTWSDHSAFLSQGTPASTGVPVFGVVKR